MAQMIQNLPAIHEMQCLTPGSGRSPGEGHGNPSSILAWRILRTEEPGELQSMGSQVSDTTQQLTL